MLQAYARNVSHEMRKNTTTSTTELRDYGYRHFSPLQFLECSRPTNRLREPNTGASTSKTPRIRRRTANTGLGSADSPAKQTCSSIPLPASRPQRGCRTLRGMELTEAMTSTSGPCRQHALRPALSGVRAHYDQPRLRSCKAVLSA